MFKKLIRRMSWKNYDFKKYICAILYGKYLSKETIDNFRYCYSVYIQFVSTLMFKSTAISIY